MLRRRGGREVTPSNYDDDGGERRRDNANNLDKDKHLPRRKTANAKVSPSARYNILETAALLTLVVLAYALVFRPYQLTLGATPE